MHIRNAKSKKKIKLNFNNDPADTISESFSLSFRSLEGFFAIFLCLQLHSNFFPYDNVVLQASLSETAKPENIHYHLNILITSPILPWSLYPQDSLSHQETMSLERRLLHVTHNSSTSVHSFPLSTCLLYSMEFPWKTSTVFLTVLPPPWPSAGMHRDTEHQCLLLGPDTSPVSTSLPLGCSTHISFQAIKPLEIPRTLGTTKPVRYSS